MTLPAVPAYIDKKYLPQASPGMRFTFYLPIWTERADQERQIRELARAKTRAGRDLARKLEKEGMDAAIAYEQTQRGRPPKLWRKNDRAAPDVWRQVQKLGKDDKTRMTALIERQQVIAQSGIAADELLVIDAKATAPFTTGLGNEHPLENGFAFLWPYGLPYLPGSGVKGVLRQAARELASGQWGDPKGWSQEPRYELMQGEGQKRRPVLDKNKQPIKLSMIDALFGRETASSESEHVRGALTFWDAIPQIEGDSLMVEVMTPHQSHYYQWKKDHDGNLIEVSPHDSGQPIPIYFLTVPPGSHFTFHVRCDLPFLRRIARDLAEEDRWKALTKAAFRHAFQWLGFGAKTAVGYGATVMDEAATGARQQKQAEMRAAAEEERQLAEATAGLPEDAAEIERNRRQSSWADNSTFLNLAEQLLAGDTPSPEALRRLKEELEKRWKGILNDPDATRGKKKKPKYKDRPKNLAKRVLELEARP